MSGLCESTIVMLRVPLIALLGGTAALSAQERTANSPPVEVASVRENKSGGRFGLDARGAPGRFRAINMTLRLLIEAAYESRTVDGPDWADTIRFDVVGIGDPTQPKPLLLQEVLRDRFAVKVRSESRQFDIYALVLARRDGKFGPGLRINSDCTDEARKKRLPVRPGELGCGTIQVSDGHLSAKGFPLRTLGSDLNSGRPVVERTGLTGDFAA
jgi:uncharacterized protein (TIGR03435 family)